jgi:hypothetical protein
VRQPHDYETPSCREIGDPDYWVEETSENIRIAKRICATCDHLVECAEYGIRNEVIGVWGGLTTKERGTLAAKQRVTRVPIMVWPTSPRRRQETDTDE